MGTTVLRRSPLQRLLGIPATAAPRDPACWRCAGGRVVVALERTPELATRGGAIRLEGAGLPDRLLVLLGADGCYHAYRNVCTHGGRRLDPVPRAAALQCCSLGRSTYAYDGEVLSGPAPECLHPYPIHRDGDTLTIELQAPPTRDPSCSDI